MTLLIDTNVAILLRDGDDMVVERLADAREPWTMSLVTLIELEGGIAADPARASTRRAGLDILVRRVAILPIDRQVVDSFAAILVQVEFSRRRILDRLIAATAIVHGVRLATMNGDDFRDISNIKLEVWSKPR